MLLEIVPCVSFVYSSKVGVIISVAMAEHEDKAELRTVYPQGEAYDCGTLQVSDIHTLKYWQYGNSCGNPVIYV